MSTYKSNDYIVQSIEESLLPVGYEEIEKAARDILSPQAFSYISSGAGAEETARKNKDAFQKYSIVPKLLNDVSEVDTSISLFERNYPTPFILAPVGVLKLADDQGDLAVTRAASKYNIPFIQSTVSSFSIEEVGQSSGAPKWFQLYWTSLEDISFSFVKRAEKAGYEAIVVTIDTVTLGFREKDLSYGYSPLADGYGQGNFESDDVFLSTVEEVNNSAIVDGIIKNINYPALNWSHISKLKEKTSLPILLKGVLHPEDAQRAVNLGVDGLIVSNHGGRQLDGVISSIDALSEIAKVVNGKIPVLFDSGIRRGSDALKALALGADAVLIGRPYVYSLAINGEKGVSQFLANFLQDFSSSMMLSGVKNMKQLQQLKIICD
ncbi:alpha-hydroxy-acid oxidizing protein [Allobacillus sp. SKP8-2]|uniref:L-lactate oxidase n=1 Tax=Allobacillus saliphilus TaxID=2912308 RepID=A0A941CXQ5_9BACI|nr:alpha-hydroxy-acid oxidizing protein [Allobacillus saliphilus]